MKEKKLNENAVKRYVKNYLLQKQDGNWHEDQVREAGLHEHGADIVLRGGKTKGAINRSYRYGLGLYWESAQVALRRIPHNFARFHNLYIFSVTEAGYVKQWSPKDFGKNHADREFLPDA